MLLPAGIQGDDRRRPLDFKIRSQGLGIEGNPKGNEIPLDEFSYLFIWIRNRIHLLTANSPRIKKVEQNLFLLRPSPGEGGFHLRFPFDLARHDLLLLPGQSGTYSMIHDP